ncbi:MAG TPA: hypothetical protein VM054_02100 [bacterium]|nr:hypothetical protein [bacterium]
MKKVLAIAVIGALVVLPGCGVNDGDGPEDYPELSLGWARLLAEEVRDAELPGGEQTYVFAGFVDSDGLIVGDESLYHFFFAEPGVLADADGLWVTVYFSGDTEHATDGCEFETPLPKFSDAAAWIEAADGALEDIGGVEFTHRTYEVREGHYEYEPPDAFIVQVDYWLEPDEHKAKVILDAETSEIIHVEDFR